MDSASWTLPQAQSYEDAVETHPAIDLKFPAQWNIPSLVESWTEEIAGV